MENDRKEIIRIEGLEKFYQLGTQQVKALNGASLKIWKTAERWRTRNSILGTSLENPPWI